MGAYQTPILKTTFVAGEDLSDSQFLGVVLNTDREIVLPTGAGEYSIGVLQEDPEADQAGAVMVAGISKLVFSETINPGQLVALTADGEGAVATTTDNVLGICVYGADADEVGSIFIDRHEANA